MPVRALMVDVDGVILVHPHPEGWSADLQRDLGLSAQLLQAALFQPHFGDVVHGRAGLRERLSPVLAGLAPHLTAERLIAYWFENDFHPDHALLAQLAEVRARGVEVHLATVQEHERAAYIWRTRGLAKAFDAIHYAADLGWAKPAPEFFQAIERRTGLASSEIAFIDDKAAKVEAAAHIGWNSRLWTGRQTLAELFPDLRGDCGCGAVG